MSNQSPGPDCRELVTTRYLQDKNDHTVFTKVPRLINIRVRIAKYCNRLFFNHRSEENKVLPIRLRFKPLVGNAKGYKRMKNTRFSVAY